MKLGFVNRALDFIGRAAMGGENGFVRHKWLGVLFVTLVLTAGIFKSGLASLGSVALVLAVLFCDVLRYNREHPNA